MRRVVNVKRPAGAIAPTAVLLGCMSVLGILLPQTARAGFFWEQPRYSADDVANVVAQRGFQPLTRPILNDDVYMADVLDRRGRRERLVVNAESGEILQRFYIDAQRRYRRFADPSIPRGPIPPGRIPDQGDQPNMFSRLFSGSNGDDPPPAVNRDSPEPMPARPPRIRRPRLVEQAPETIRRTPIESAPLAPPPAEPVAPAPARPVQAALPPSPPAAQETPAVKDVPVAAPAVTPSDKPVRSISRDPLAIPGTREQDAKTARPVASEPRPSGAAVTKPPAPKAVPVAPLE